MIKLILLAFLGTALGEGYNGPLYSMHIPPFIPTLKLSTGELKQFSGHALNIIRSKCPSVDSKKIFQVQKYIGKFIAKSDPQPGTSKEFKTLLETITTCEKEGPPKHESKESKEHLSAFTPIFPFHHFAPFPRLPFPNFPSIDEVPASVISGIDPGLNVAQPAITGLDQVSQAMPMPPPELQLNPTHKVITTIFVRPQDMQEGVRTSGGFFNWIHNMFAKVNNFFSNIFPFGQRKKRDLSEFPEAQQDEKAFETIETSEIKFPEVAFTKKEKDDSQGKRAFGELVDQMCRLYCDTCEGKKEMLNFKMAAKQLLTYMFEEDAGLELAAKKYVDEDILNSINECE